MPNYKHKSSKADGKHSRVPYYVEKLNEKTRENFLIDIQNLETRLEKYRDKFEDALKRRDDLLERLSGLQHKEQNSINKFSQELEDKTKELEDLKERINELIQTNETERETNETTLNEKKQEFQSMKMRLGTENQRLAKELQSLEEFKVNKSDFTRKVKSLENELERNKREFENYLNEMQIERKRELAKIKKEALERLEEAGSKFKEQTKKERPETLKRVMREELQVGQHLNQLSGKSDEVEAENKNLKKMIKEDEMKIRDLEAREKKLFEKIVVTKKIIKLMEDKLKEDNETIKRSKLAENDVLQEAIEVDNLRNTVKKAREDEFNLRGIIEQTENTKETNERHLQELDKDIDRLKNILEESVTFLQRNLTTLNTTERKKTVAEENFDQIASEVYKILKRKSIPVD